MDKPKCASTKFFGLLPKGGAKEAGSVDASDLVELQWDEALPWPDARIIADPKESDFTSGKLLVTGQGDFLLLHLLGQGGFGSAWEVIPMRTMCQSRMFPAEFEKEIPSVPGLYTFWTEEELEEILCGVGLVFISHVLKIVTSGLRAGGAHQGVVLRTEREFRLLTMMRGESCVPTPISYGTRPVQWLCMALCEGPTLEQIIDSPEIAKYRGSHGQLRLGFVLSMGISLAGAVNRMHGRKIAHRDLKPANVVVQVFDDGFVPRLLDLGIGAHLPSVLSESDTQRLTRRFGGVGTPAYVAPEQLTTPTQANLSADVFSLGRMMWELFAARPLFEGLPPGGIMQVLMTPLPEVKHPEIRRAYILGLINDLLRGEKKGEEMVGGMCDLKPERRPTMREVAQRLQAIRVHQTQAVAVVQAKGGK